MAPESARFSGVADSVGDMAADSTEANRRWQSSSAFQ